MHMYLFEFGYEFRDFHVNFIFNLEISWQSSVSNDGRCETAITWIRCASAYDLKLVTRKFANIFVRTFKSTKQKRGKTRNVQVENCSWISFEFRNIVLIHFNGMKICRKPRVWQTLFNFVRQGEEKKRNVRNSIYRKANQIRIHRMKILLIFLRKKKIKNKS